MKQFLIIGGVGNTVYLETFNLIKNNIVKYRPNRIHKFENGVAVAATWYTTMETPYIPPLELTKSYNPEDYPKYDNYDAIEVSKTINIPYDYEGVIGVPVTFLDKWNPEQFEIITIACGNSWKNYNEILKSLNFNPNIKYGGGLGVAVLNGVPKFSRIMIKNKMI